MPQIHIIAVSILYVSAAPVNKWWLVFWSTSARLFFGHRSTRLFDLRVERWKIESKLATIEFIFTLDGYWLVILAIGNQEYSLGESHILIFFSYLWENQRFYSRVVTLFCFKDYQEKRVWKFGLVEAPPGWLWQSAANTRKCAWFYDSTLTYLIFDDRTGWFPSKLSSSP